MYCHSEQSEESHPSQGKLREGSGRFFVVQTKWTPQNDKESWGLVDNSFYPLLYLDTGFPKRKGFGTNKKGAALEPPLSGIRDQVGVITPGES